MHISQSEACSSNKIDVSLSFFPKKTVELQKTHFCSPEINIVLDRKAALSNLILL